MPIRTKTIRQRVNRLAIAAACAAIFSSADNAQAQIVKANNTTALNDTGSWGGGVVPGATDIAQWNNTVVGANSSVLGASLSWQGISITNPGGGVTIAATTGATLTLGTSGINMSSATQNLTIASLLALGSAQTWDVASGRTLTVSGAVSGSGALTKTGTGTASINVASTFSGGLTVLAGAATTNNATGFGTGNITLGNALTNDAAIISGTVNGTIANAINLSTLANGVLTIRGANNTSGQTVTYSGLISTTAGTPVLQTSATGNGALTLSNATFNPTASLVNVGTGTGSVTISGAIGTNVTSITQNSPTSTLILSGANTYNNGISIKAGSLRLAGTATAGGPATNVITLGDTTGAVAANLSQNFGGTIPNPIVLSSGTTGVLTIDSPNTGTLGVLSGGVTGTNNFRINGSNTQGISFTTGAIANVGTVTNVGVGGGAAQISSNITSTVTNVTQNSATSNLRLSGTNTYGTSTVTSGVLSFLTTSAMPGYPNPTGSNLITVASGGTVALGYGAASGQFSNADILALGSTGTPISFAATGSSLGIDTTSAAGGTATYAGTISNPTGIVLGFNKVGAGTLILTGSNTYTGPTTISQGFLSAVQGVGIPATSNLTIAGSGGTGVSTSGTYVPTVANYEATLGAGAGQVQVLGTNSGFTSRLANQVVAFGTIASPTALTWGSASFNPAALVLNETGATNTIDFRNALDLGAAARTVTVNATGVTNAATLSGALTGTGGGLTKAGGGLLNITNTTNSYTGGTAVTAGTLSFNGTGTLPTGSAVTITPGATLQILNDASGTIAYGNNVNLAGTTATFLNVGNNGGATTGSTIALGELNGPATSANTQTNINVNATNGYEVSFTKVNLAGGTGQGLTLVANTNVKVLGDVVNRMSGTLSTTNLDTLALQGTATGSYINGVIADGSGRTIVIGGHTIVTKTGTGTWTLRGANTYTGGTNVNAGTLVLDGGAGGTIGRSLVTVGSAGGTLNIIGNTTIGDAASTLNAIGGTVVVVGGATAATRGTVSLLDGSINTLTITGNSFTPAATQSLTLGGTTAGAFSILNFDSNNTTVDNITLTGGNSNQVLLQLGGATVNLNALPATGLPVGNHNLLTFATGSVFTGTFTLGTVTTAPGTYAYLNTPTSASTNLTLTVATAASGNVFWTGTQPAWNSNPTGPVTGFVNAYSGGANALLPGSNTNVFLTDTAITANLSHSTGQSFTINSLNFTGTGTPAATNSITLAGTSPLTLLGSTPYSDQNAVAQGANTALAVQAGSAAHTISSPLAIGANQVWQQDSANALTVSGVISGTGTTLNKAGSGTVILTAANTFDGVLTISGGSLQLGAAGTTGALAPASTLVINSNLTINRTNAVLQGTDLSSGVISGSGTLTQAGTGTTTLTADNSYSGGTTISVGILQVGNAGTTGAAGTGPISVATGTTLAFNRTNTSTLAATSLITGAGTVRLASGGTVSTAIDGQFNTTGNLTFGAAANGATGGNLDLTNGSSTFGGLLSQTNSTTANTITIGTGKTLTINGNVDMTNTVDNADNLVTMTGGGNLNVTGATFFVGRNTGGTGIGATATMDLSGLANFNANLSGNLAVQQTGDNNPSDSATLKLANNNTITAASILVGNSGTASSNLMVLGSGTNVLNANTIGIGIGGRDAGVVNFAGATGSVKIRGTDGTAPAIFNLATGGSATGVGGNFSFDVTGHNADLLLSTLSIGTQNRAATFAPSFSFDQGTMTMDSLTMATRSVAGSTANGLTAGRTTNASLNIGGGTVNILNGILALGETKTSSNVTGFTTTSNGTVNISGGTVNIGETGGTSVSMAETTIANVAASGTLNFTGGSTTFAGNIIKVGGAGTTATFTLNGGSVNMSNKNIGSATLIDNINLQAGTLSDVNEINGGAAVSKTTTGVLNYTGNNAYTGATTVAAGTLRVNGTLPNSAVTVNTGATLGGSGTIGGVTIVSGSVAPGNSAIGPLAVTNNVTWNAGNAWVWELGTGGGTIGTPGTGDLLNITGDFIKGTPGAFTFDFSNTGAAGVYKLVDWSGSSLFAAGDFTASNLASGLTSSFTVDNTTSALYLTLQSTGSSVVLGAAAANSGAFGNLLVGANASTTVTLTNNGTVATTSISANGPLPGFTLGAPVSGTVNPAANTTASVTVDTSSPGLKSGNLTYTANPGSVVSTPVIALSAQVGNALYGTTMTAATPALYVTPAGGLSSTGTGTAASSTPVALNSTATVLYYRNSTGTDTSVNMNWRTRTAAEAKLGEPLQTSGTNGSGKAVGYLISDVVSLTGMVNTTGVNATDPVRQTDPFVLQVSYNQGLLGSDPVSAQNHETAGAPLGHIFLAWNDSGTWVNAVEGNIGGTPTFAGVTSWQTYYNMVSGVDDYTDIASFIGSYGVDPANDVAWAVLNHNSEFAVIPEPSTLVLGGLALLGFAGMNLRRRRLAKQGA